MPNYQGTIYVLKAGKAAELLKTIAEAGVPPGGIIVLEKEDFEILRDEVLPLPILVRDEEPKVKVERRLGGPIGVA